MVSRVTIKKSYTGWRLTISSLQHGIRRTFDHNRLIDAIGMANTLRLHIDNIDELPLPQYSGTDYKRDTELDLNFTRYKTT